MPPFAYFEEMCCKEKYLTFWRRIFSGMPYLGGLPELYAEGLKFLISNNDIHLILAMKQKG